MSDAPTTNATDAPAEQAVESDPVREALLARLVDHFGDAIVGSHVGAGDLWVRVAPQRWRDVAAYCKTTLNLRFFDFLGGIDWLNNPNLSGEKTWDPEGGAPVLERTNSGYAGGDTRFQVICRLLDVATNVGVTFKVDLDDENPTVDSIADIYAGAEWHEREAWEMFGFAFAGHPGLRHLYLPGGFEGYPLRKDFPMLAREIKPWPGLVDKEPMPGEDAMGDEEGGGGDE